MIPLEGRAGSSESESEEDSESQTKDGDSLSNCPLETPELDRLQDIVELADQWNISPVQQSINISRLSLMCSTSGAKRTSNSFRQSRAERSVRSCEVFGILRVTALSG